MSDSGVPWGYLTQLAGGLYGGYGNLQAGRANRKTRRDLTNRAGRLRDTADPIWDELLAGYAPGGDISNAILSEKLGRNFQSEIAARENAKNNAWRYGGNFGRTARANTRTGRVADINAADLRSGADLHGAQQVSFIQGLRDSISDRNNPPTVQGNKNADIARFLTSLGAGLVSGEGGII